MTTQSKNMRPQTLNELLESTENLYRGEKAKDALKYLVAAYEQNQSSSDCTAVGRIATAIAHVLIATGHVDLAVPYLQEAFNIAVQTDDTLMITTRGSILCALLLAHKQDVKSSTRKQLRVTANAVIAAASERGNWLGIVDGILTLVSVDLEESKLGPAVNRIRDAHTNLTQRRASPAAIHLLIARLVELREIHGADTLRVHLRR